MTIDTNIFREKILLNKEARTLKTIKDENEKQYKLRKNYGVASVL
jgi:hypothetical protein